MEYFIIENPNSRQPIFEYDYPCGIRTYSSYERAKEEVENMELKNYVIAVYCSEDRNYLI
jgi:hypothetical protein